jgi:hypothetical protein
MTRYWNSSNCIVDKYLTKWNIYVWRFSHTISWQKFAKKWHNFFHCTGSKVFDRVKSVALWSANLNVKLIKIPTLKQQKYDKILEFIQLYLLTEWWLKELFPLKACVTWLIGYSYLLINIHFQLIIITNVSILPQWQDGGTK